MVTTADYPEVLSEQNATLFLRALATLESERESSGRSGPPAYHEVFDEMAATVLGLTRGRDGLMTSVRWSLRGPMDDAIEAGMKHGLVVLRDQDGEAVDSLFCPVRAELTQAGYEFLGDRRCDEEHLKSGRRRFFDSCELYLSDNRRRSARQLLDMLYADGPSVGDRLTSEELRVRLRRNSRPTRALKQLYPLVDSRGSGIPTWGLTQIGIAFYTERLRDTFLG